MFNRDELKELIVALQNQFDYQLTNSRLKAYFLLLNTCISKAQLSKREPFYSIELKQKYIKNLSLPTLSDVDIEFFSNYYDYLYIIINEEEQVNEHVDNKHIFRTLNESVDYLYLELLYPEEVKSGSPSSGGLFFREYFDENISFDNHHKTGRELPAELGYIQNISKLSHDKQISVISFMYKKRREPDDFVRNYQILAAIRVRTLLEEIKFFEYKYTSFKK